MNLFTFFAIGLIAAWLAARRTWRLLRVRIGAPGFLAGPVAFTMMGLVFFVAVIWIPMKLDHQTKRLFSQRCGHLVTHSETDRHNIRNFEWRAGLYSELSLLLRHDVDFVELPRSSTWLHFPNDIEFAQLFLEVISPAERPATCALYDQYTRRSDNNIEAFMEAGGFPLTDYCIGVTYSEDPQSDYIFDWAGSETSIQLGFPTWRSAILKDFGVIVRSSNTRIYGWQRLRLPADQLLISFSINGPPRGPACFTPAITSVEHHLTPRSF